MYQPSELRVILNLFPECPRVTKSPSIDAIVCEYLQQHDVNIKPVSSDVQPNRVTNAAMGAIGGGAVLAANTHLTVQQKSVALQEWTTWKQWALSQPDFKDFKSSMLEKSKTEKEMQDKWIEENQERIKAALVKRQADIHKENMFTMKLFAGVVAFIFVAAGIDSIVDRFRQPSIVPQSEQRR